MTHVVINRIAAAEVTELNHEPEMELKHLQDELGPAQKSAKKALCEARKKVDNHNSISTPDMVIGGGFTIIYTKPANTGIVGWVEDF